MGRQWKPGDVVTATVDGRPNVRLVAGWSKFDPQLRWCEMSPRWGDGDDDECWFLPNRVKDHRPLVVIDPEDREQVGRLMTAIRPGAMGGTDNLAAALRSLVADPKPEEPTGLGAVVEDADGNRWVRVDTDDDPWLKMPPSGWAVDSESYTNVTAVRVLSEGVTP